MYELNQKYIEQLELIAENIQDSEELAQYLEEEEEEFYNQLKEAYEPRLAEMYQEVAHTNPLQLVSLELVLLDPAFEGLFLPRILGYSVLRGQINEHYKYVRPQEHFKQILLTICDSSNFDLLKKRIGQTIQIGFALSSDIWITNLIAGITNKKVSNYLQAQKLERFLDENERKNGYVRYARQFHNENYLSADFPTDRTSLLLNAAQLKRFLTYRISAKVDNSNLINHIDDLVAHEDFYGVREHFELMLLYGCFFEHDEASEAILREVVNDVRRNHPEVAQWGMEYVRELHRHSQLDLGPANEKRFAALLDKSINDELAEYFQLADTVHTKGYTNIEAQDAVKEFYLQHEGLSVANECVRQMIFRYFRSFINNLENDAYTDFFEICRLFQVYMNIFSNQQFNQDLEDLSMEYVGKLLLHYTDKRGKDYQDIKRFVSSTLQDFRFVTEKEVVEMFKTKRKKKED
ncbi:MAG: hypothetical protein IAE84_10000 [Saprospiraceae bacterium]|jgi:hypothetical protein|nr:hypothetical protein [Saprospiraceae bacterium]HRD81181.1 hypothetical protein [Saprospiraceae bacterium]HRF37787.1 hypothetical protein [Saprospiraceae bacterium]HRJ14468.1 hypothetical protein [Saprospiraceae bacterium]HRK81456.1 hypothetical protein [Saprospiraceae bacterium]